MIDRLKKWNVYITISEIEAFVFSKFGYTSDAYHRSMNVSTLTLVINAQSSVSNYQSYAYGQMKSKPMMYQ